MDEVINELARVLFEHDTGVTRADISWGNVSADVSNNYRNRARSLLSRMTFKGESLYIFLENQL